ncbi:MAG: pilus assembly protein FimV [Pseudomonadota bacterium]|nr:pilus assembly protein FimV [Pseudomonadota bacterium]
MAYYRFLIILIFKFFLWVFFVQSQPLVILEYSDANNVEIKNINDENYSTYYTIKKNDTLSNIIEKYYGNKGLNFTFVQAAILYKNKNAFVRSNPNFMYAKKKLYLPSINEIKELVYKDKKKLPTIKDTAINQEIYFFGN